MVAPKEKYPHLLDPAHLGGHAAVRWMGNRAMASWLNRAAERAASQEMEPQPIAVLVNARRPRHPEFLANKRRDSGTIVAGVERTLDSIERQEYPPELVQETVVMLDEGMLVRPPEQNRLQQRSRLLRKKRYFNHSHALNDGLEEARRMGPSILMILDADTQYATDQAFRAAAQALNYEEGAVGAFGSRLPNAQASVAQSVFRFMNALSYSHLDHPIDAPIDTMSFIPANGMAYAAPELQYMPFDEGYSQGGGNNQFVRSRHADHERFVYHPALSVQSGERFLGPVALLRTALAEARMSRPTEYF